MTDEDIRAALAEALYPVSASADAAREIAQATAPTVRRLMQQQAAEERETGDTGVWIDPARRSGEPCVGGSRVPVEMVANAVWWHGVDGALTQWPHLSRAQVLNACWYAAVGHVVRLHGKRGQYVAHRWRYRKAWVEWAEEIHDLLWKDEHEFVIDPPSASVTETAP